MAMHGIDALLAPTEKDARTVLLPVPEEFLPEAILAIAEVIRRSRESGPAVQETEEVVGFWTIARARLLWDEVQAYPGAADVIYRTAEQPGKGVWIDDLLSADRTRSKFQGDMAALTKLLKKLFGEVVWPVKPTTGKEQGTYYIMLPSVAKVFREVLGIE